jgi:hypothetical protein
MIPNRSKKKIFLGLSEIAGFYVGLEQGLKELGLKVTRIDLSSHRFKYKNSHQNFLIKSYLYAANKFKNSAGWLQNYWKFNAVVLKALLFSWAVCTHKVFIFSYGTSFFRLQDLRLLKLLRKKIIFQFHGSDSRPPFIDGIFIKQCDLEQIQQLTKQKKQQLEKINHYADAIVDLPTMGLFHSKAFVNCLRIGLPTCVPVDMSVGASQDNDTIKILHAPSNPIAKGTQYIEDCIKELQQSGVNIELIKIQNLPNVEVLKAIAGCDFLVDQMFSDTLMPGLATEAAWFQKPTVLCGYANHVWQKSLPSDLHPPTHYCHPSELKAAILKLAMNKEYRTDLGSKAHQFVKQCWHPKKIAEQYLKIINNDLPLSCYVDPQELTYTHGCAIEETELKVFLLGYLKQFGKESLHLSDKPSLEDAFLKFAGLNP